MKVWTKGRGYIFDQYRDTVKRVLECVEESPIARQMARLGETSEVYKCRICKRSPPTGVTFGNEYLKMRNLMYSTVVYYRIPCGNIPAYVHVNIGRYSTTPIFVQICILDSQDTWLVFSLVKSGQDTHSVRMDGGLKSYECLGL